jgi:hypothetical protein
MINNKIESLVNNSSQLQPELKNETTNVFECMEKRYGFKLNNHVLICENRDRTERGVLPDCFVYRMQMIPPHIAIKRIKGVYNIENSTICNLDELYMATITGFNSREHPINKNAKENECIISLIPVISITRENITHIFQVDNHIIREFFYDTEDLMEGSISEENMKSINRRFLEHLEFLEYLFATPKSILSPKLWFDIYNEKFTHNKVDMLHSEYLEWKSQHIN